MMVKFEIVRRYYQRAKTLAFSKSAKDTYILFVGNVISAFFGFLFTILVARTLTVSDFGVFSAASNLIFLIGSFTDLGISTGVVRFIANASAKKNEELVKKYIKSAMLIRVVVISIVAALIVSSSRFISSSFLATENQKIAYWVAGISWFYLFYTLYPFILQAKQKFFKSAIIEVHVTTVRLIIAFLIFVGLGLTLEGALFSFFVASILTALVGVLLTGSSFLKVKVDSGVHKSLLYFSGWLGVNKIISSFSGRLDVQMLANMTGAETTGYYSISQRLGFFIVVLTSSFSSVLAPRLAAFNNKKKELAYLKKATLAILPIIFGIIIWIVIAKPFIIVLFGEKYEPSVSAFQILAASMIPFLLTAPSVSAIIYAMKKPVYIGVFSFVQVVLIFLLNLYLIPEYGVEGPAITYAVVNTLLALYTWYFVVKYYRKS